MSEPTIDAHLPSVPAADILSRRERRGRPRTPVAYVRCFSPAPGVIFNVSSKGVAIETFRCFDRGDSVFLTGEVAGRPQRASGHVRWCRQIATAGESGSPVYQVGIALTERLERSWLSALIEASAH